MRTIDEILFQAEDQLQSLMYSAGALSEAIQLLHNRGVKVGRIADSLSLPESTVRNWIRTGRVQVPRSTFMGTER